MPGSAIDGGVSAEGVGVVTVGVGGGGVGGVAGGGAIVGVAGVNAGGLGAAGVGTVGAIVPRGGSPAPVGGNWAATEDDTSPPKRREAAKARPTGRIGARR